MKEYYLFFSYKNKIKSLKFKELRVYGEHIGVLSDTPDVDDTDSKSALELEPEDEETLTSPEVRTKEIVDRTEKLKKQANAKFNKGDFTALLGICTRRGLM
jgi:hypothetical protein